MKLDKIDIVAENLISSSHKATTQSYLQLNEGSNHH
jgi:hypothetical protein